jgi:DHA1 family multidrug resistance protein-like MFS transporter
VKISTADAPEKTDAPELLDALKALRQAIFLISLPLGILSFILPVYGAELGAGAVQIGLFFSVFSLALVLLRPLVGAGLDRYGRRPFALAGLAGYTISMLVFALWVEVWGVIVARVVQGVAAACLWIAIRAITADVAQAEQRGRTFGGMEQASSQGSMLGIFIAIALLMGVVEVGNPWPVLFGGYGAAGLVALWLAWRGLPETRVAAPAATEERERRPLPHSRAWTLLLWIAAVTSASGAMVGPIVLFYLQDRLGATTAEVGYAYLPAVLIAAFASAPLGTLADRFGRKPLMLLGMGVAAASSLLLPGLSTLFALAALQAVQALSSAASNPAQQSLVADLTGGDQRGRAYGVYALAGGLGATVGPLAGGWLYERVSPAAPFYGNGMVLALSMLVLWAFLRVPAAQTSEGKPGKGEREKR